MAQGGCGGDFFPGLHRSPLPRHRYGIYSVSQLRARRGISNILIGGKSTPVATVSTQRSFRRRPRWKHLLHRRRQHGSHDTEGRPHAAPPASKLTYACMTGGGARWPISPQGKGTISLFTLYNSDHMREAVETRASALFFFFVGGHLSRILHEPSPRVKRRGAAPLHDKVLRSGCSANAPARGLWVFISDMLEAEETLPPAASPTSFRPLRYHRPANPRSGTKLDLPHDHGAVRYLGRGNAGSRSHDPRARDPGGLQARNVDSFSRKPWAKQTSRGAQVGLSFVSSRTEIIGQFAGPAICTKREALPADFCIRSRP